MAKRTDEMKSYEDTKGDLEEQLRQEIAERRSTIGTGTEDLTTAGSPAAYGLELAAKPEIGLRHGRADLFPVYKNDTENELQGVVVTPPTNRSVNSSARGIEEDFQVKQNEAVANRERIRAQKDRVRGMQQMLASQGFYEGDPDGVYDEKTVTAIRAAQAQGVNVAPTSKK
tara:strand:+ start:1487 stop:1999 length:513 start_codon:yes stop_codon:yes gene_type:complete